MSWSSYGANLADIGYYWFDYKSTGNTFTFIDNGHKSICFKSMGNCCKSTGFKSIDNRYKYIVF